jgi:Ca2+-binding EF-hand superfamily protein
LFRDVDNNNSGDLKIDQIKDTYMSYCGKFADKEEIDKILSHCTVKKLGSISYTQFV